jgi:hypothetical protein
LLKYKKIGFVQEYPLGEEHWINQPVAAGNGEPPQLLLQLSVQQPAVEFTQLLIRAGAKADMYSDDYGQGGTKEDCF